MQSFLSTIVSVMLLQVSAASGPVARVSASNHSACPAGEHIHRFGDLRIKVIRVERTGDCGFEYADLENNSVGLPKGNDHRWDYSEKFELARFKGNQVEWLGRGAVQPGMMGVAIYCSFQGCGRVLVLQLIKHELLSFKG